MKRLNTYYINRFNKFRILVIGDLIIDVYLSGSCSRLAPEGTFPVIDLDHRRVCLGGAGNVAANLRALGCKVELCTVTGDDDIYRDAEILLNEAGVAADTIVKDSSRRSLVKTRVSSPSQTVARFDEGTTDEPGIDILNLLISRIRKAYAQCDAVLIADYKKGVITPYLIEEILRLKEADPKFIAVDAKDITAFSALRPSLIKPNYEEALKILSMARCDADRVETLKELGGEFYRATAAQITALTLDNAGSLFFKGAEFQYRSHAPEVGMPEVSGAGDTFISTCMLALLSGADIAVSAELSTAAAAIAVKKKGTAICQQGELLALMAAGEKEITSLALLKTYCRIYRSQGKRIVFTNGCFDILHSGHVSYLSRARELGDVLIVGLNNDESISRLKGKSRPVNKLPDRREVLSALSCVDHIVSFGKPDDDTPVALIRAIQPEIFVKGGDYAHRTLPESEILKSIGAQLVFLPYVPNQSTTQIITKIEEDAKWKIAILN